MNLETTEYEYLGNMPLVALKRSNTNASVNWISANHLDSPHAVLRKNGSRLEGIWRWDTDPYGSMLPTEIVKFTMNLRFPGQVYDKETGTHYNVFRDYDPQTGRYLQADPIGLGGGMNRWGYVGGNPMNGVDPLGLHPFLIYLAGEFFVSGGISAGVYWLVADCPTIGGAAQAFAEGGILGVLTGGTGAGQGLVGLARGRISTGRNIPNNPYEASALQNAINETGGTIKVAMGREKINNPYFLGMDKWRNTTRYITENGQEEKIVIHYMKDPTTGRMYDFKFKNH